MHYIVGDKRQPYAVMSTISSGIRDLDDLIDSFYIGDNVVWEVDAGTSSDLFIRNFIRQSALDGQNLIYVSFNKSPQSVLQQIREVPSEGFLLVDCFTSGKGKNDRTFLKFYEKGLSDNVTRVERPGDIGHFTEVLNTLEDSLPPGARYIFDSLTGMQDLWDNEQSTYKFFTYMCPRLYDLGTVAYWIVEKEAHTQAFKANIRHITQAVLELYKRKDSLYIKTHKLDGRHSREAFKPHTYSIKGDEIFISRLKKEPAYDIGTKIREMRTRLGMNQKELAEKVDLTPSFISQIENNQISPSLSSFLHICIALGINPEDILKTQKTTKPAWLIKSDTVLSTPFQKDTRLEGYKMMREGGVSVDLYYLEPKASIKGHLTAHRGKEFIYVLNGSLLVSVENKAELIEKGDAIFLRTEQPSLWENKGGSKAMLLVACF